MKKSIFYVVIVIFIVFFSKLDYVSSSCNYQWIFNLANEKTREINYLAETKYIEEWNNAVYQWNLGRVTIQPTPSGKENTITIKDYYKVSDELGYISKREEVIAFNDYTYSSLTFNQRKKTALHELGHALGIKDITDKPFPIITVMRQGRIELDFLGNIDVQIYSCIWKRDDVYMKKFTDSTISNNVIRHEYDLKASIILLVLLLSITCGLFLKMILIIKNKEQIIYVSADLAYNPDNPEEKIEFSDYVFIGEVKSYIGSFNEENWNVPYSMYDIKVIENIKGELVENIIVKRNSGYNEDNVLVLFDDTKDTLPKVNQRYLFLAMAQDDGELLLLTGGNGNMEFTDEFIMLIKNYIEKGISFYRKGSFEPIVRERFVSKYEK